MKAITIDKQLKQCVKLIQDAKSIGVLTGAGISTSTGIPDFRGPQGLYVTRRYDPEKVFDIDYFHRDPKPFFEFARDFIQLEDQIKPTRAHYFLSDLERRGHLKGVITQNIDYLHQQAGSQNVLEVHGSFWESHCCDCGRNFSYKEMKVKIHKEEIPRCVCGGLIKPDIVFFGENVKHLDEAFHLAETSDLFFVIGTSCVVYPAAMIPHRACGQVVVINMDPVHLDQTNVVLTIQEDIDQFCGQVGQLLWGEGPWVKSPLNTATSRKKT